MKIQNFINGEYYSTQNNFTKKNPFTNESLSTVYDSNIVDVVASVQGAQKAFVEWRSSTKEQRLDLLGKIKAAYIEKQNELVKFESLDQGLPLFFTQTANYNIGLKLFDRFKTELEAGATSPFVQPVGVIAIVLSWNLSNRLFIERVIPAIMAGNAVVVKISSLAPSTALTWAEILQTAQVPKGLVQIINGASEGFKNLIVTHPGVRAVSAVGTLKTTSNILKKTSELSHNQFKKIQLSSGTKNSALALIEPNKQIAMQIFDSFFLGQGQLAWNSARLFVLEKNEDLWKQALSDYTANLKPSEGIEDASTWTPLLRQSSFQTFKDLETLAKADQAKLLRSEVLLNDIQIEKFVAPTFTKDMSNCSTLQQDEVSTPLYILSTVKYPFDIPKYSNVSYYGFSASAWGDPEKLQKIIQQLDVGLISLNKWSIFASDSFVPVKQSSFGIQDYRIFGDFLNNVKTLAHS